MILLPLTLLTLPIYYRYFKIFHHFACLILLDKCI